MLYDNIAFRYASNFVKILERDSDMVRCSHVDCMHGAWFHKVCLSIKELPDSSVDWYCSEECAELSTTYSQTDVLPTPDGEMDFVRNYAVSVVWNGLLDNVHRDSIREADGLMMMTLWRVNMTRFWNGHNFKYMKVGHRLLAGSFHDCLIIVIDYPYGDAAVSLVPGSQECKIKTLLFCWWPLD